MKFTALPVNVGDSFLLQGDGKTVLVDGGMNRKQIVKLLCNEKLSNNHIDLLICTHYDSDHINGIIGILKSGKFSLSEIWLPEILGSLGYTLSKKISELFSHLRNNEFPKKEYSIDEVSIFSQYESKEIEENTRENNSLEDIDNAVLDNISSNNFWQHEALFFQHGYIHRQPWYKMAASLKSVASLIGSSLHSGAYIRWFKYQEKQTHKSYGFNVYSENAIQTDITLYSEDLFFRALYQITLSKINKYSLVYLHKLSDTPDILFTSDSDLNFYQNKVQLKDSSIVTAPHHGSAANDIAYQKSKGNDLVYVRSDRSQLKRPGKGYLNIKKRYCTICRNKTKKQKVEMSLTGSSFTTNARSCSC